MFSLLVLIELYTYGVPVHPKSRSFVKFHQMIKLQVLAGAIEVVILLLAPIQVIPKSGILLNAN